jgi:hypothetical protein
VATALQAGDILEFKIWTTDSEQASVNTFHYLVDTVGTPAGTDADFNTGLESLVAATWKTLINNNATFKGTTTQIINRIPKPVYVTETGSAGVGSAGAIAGPRQAAGLISLKTNYAGSRYRGRSYIPFPSSTDMSGNGVPGSAYTTKLTTLNGILLAWVTVTTGGRSADFDLVVYSKKFSTTALVLTILARTAWATIKKRGTYGRPNTSPI